MSALDGGEWSISRSGRSIPGEQSPQYSEDYRLCGTHRRFEGFGEEKCSCPYPYKLPHIQWYHFYAVSKWYISKGQLACNDPVTVTIWPLLWQFTTLRQSSCCTSQVPNWEANDACFSFWCTYQIRLILLLLTRISLWSSVLPYIKNHDSNCFLLLLLTPLFRLIPPLKRCCSFISKTSSLCYLSLH